MRTLRIIIMMLLLTTHELIWADFDEGIAAFKRGDHAAAAQEFQTLAEHGDAKAQTLLGAMHEDGVGVQQDYTEAVKWYRSAAEQGLAEAQYNSGRMYFVGQGTSVNYKEARKWLRKAAEQGLPDAQYSLGWMYDNGVIERNYKEAVLWYLKAAEQGHPDAQTYLGHKYSSGLGTHKDEKEAIKLYTKAAAQGQAEAQFSLGQYYNTGGESISKDYVQACKWYIIALNRWLSVADEKGVMETFGISGALGVKKATENLEHISSEMTPEQITEAKKLAKEWMEQHQ